MKLKDLITESVKEPVLVSSINRLIQEKCSDALNCGVPLYRGMTIDESEAFLLDYKKGNKLRKSATGSDVLLQILPKLKSWKDIPDRRQSVSMTTDFNWADSDNFGSGHAQIFPIDGSIMCVYPSKDINSTPPENLKDLDFDSPIQFVKWSLLLTAKILQPPKQDDKKLHYYDINIATFTRVNNLMKYHKKHFGRDILPTFNWYSALRDNKSAIECSTILEFFDYMLSPEQTGIIICDIKDLHQHVTSSHEIWTDSPCYAKHFVTTKYHDLSGKIVHGDYERVLSSKFRRKKLFKQRNELQELISSVTSKITNLKSNSQVDDEIDLPEQKIKEYVALKKQLQDLKLKRIILDKELEKV